MPDKTTDKYSFKFTLDTAQTSDLIEGSLKLYKNGEVINEYRATSSTKANQKDGSWLKRHGLIPPSKDLKGKGYQVDTTAIYMPEKPGIRGNFYKITPFIVSTDGDDRGDFGFHRDIGEDGSWGCVVLMSARGWEAIQRDIANIAAVGIKQVPLVVEYI
jgi:hypothetical protein